MGKRFQRSTLLAKHHRITVFVEINDAFNYASCRIYTRKYTHKGARARMVEDASDRDV